MGVCRSRHTVLQENEDPHITHDDHGSKNTKRHSTDSKKRRDKSRGGTGKRRRTPTAEAELLPNVFKLLFLGAGESGKSTLYKGMQIRYGAGFSEEDRSMHTPTVFENTISSMKTLMEQSQLFDEAECDISVDLQRSVDILSEIKEEDALIDQTLAEHITALWKDPGIQNTYKRRAEFQLVDSAKYFFDSVMRISTEDYIPTEADFLRCRDRTTGILCQKFYVQENEFHVYDVGGQRAERRKWVNCFKNVKAVLFVVAISEYDQLCFEDNVTNRLTEALAVFDNVCNSKWFETTPIVLLFNKIDLFRTKIESGVSLSACFSDFEGPNKDYDAACEFIWSQFEERNKTPKQIYRHYVCATGDQDHVSDIFHSVHEIVLEYGRSQQESDED